MAGRGWVIALVALGCGEVTTIGGDGGVDVDARPGSLVGVKNEIRTTEEGVVTRPVDLSSVPIQVLVAGGDPIVGTGDAEGRFEILDVPPGEVFLQVGTTYVVTAERDLDLSRVAQGRPEPPLGGLGSRLQLSITGLSSWTDASDLWLTVPNSAAIYSMAAPPDLGATELVGNVPLLNEPLLDPSLGDVFRVVQTEQVDDTGGLYRVAVRAFEASVTSADGETTTVAGSFTPVTRDEEAWVDLRESDFIMQLAEITDFEVPPSYHLRAGPAIPDYDTGLIEVARVAGDPAVTGVVTVSFGRPFADFTLWEDANNLFSYDLDPDPDVCVLGLGGLFESAPFGTLSGDQPIRPALGLVRNVTVDGRPALEPQTVPAGAELAWDAPSLGEPDDYAVLVYAVPAGGGAGELLARIVTPGTSVRLQPTDLEPGTRLTVRITARQRPGYSARQPELLKGRRAESVFPTAILTIE
jgi:hypothetical protein